MLKLQAWRDRRLITTRDAIDLRTILHAYSDGPYLDQLYDIAEHILAIYDFDPQLAGAHHLGVELRNTLGAAIAEDCRQIVAAEADGDDPSPQKWAARSSTTNSSSTPPAPAPPATGTKHDDAADSRLDAAPRLA